MELFISTNKISTICNPIVSTCWRDVENPITLEEIEEAKPIQYPLRLLDARQHHAGRIKWFVVYGWNDPIEIDVGVPSLGCRVAWPVVDGNHRLTAAIIRQECAIRARCSGSVQEIMRLAHKVQER